MGTSMANYSPAQPGSSFRQPSGHAFHRCVSLSTRLMPAAKPSDVIHGDFKTEFIDGCVATLSQKNRQAYQDMRGLQQTAADNLRNLALKRLETTPYNRLHLHYIALPSEQTPLILTVAPSSSKVLRGEYESISSEIAVLRWLSDTDILGNRKHDKEPDIGHSCQNSDKGHRCLASGFSSKIFLPEIIKHGYTTFPQSGEFLLTKRRQGTVLSALSRTLHKQQRKRIDFEIGQLIRRLAFCQSPNGQFGDAPAVLRQTTSASVATSLHQGPDAGTAHSCWSDAFLSLLEAVLRDAEDVAVSIPYERIREHARRFRKLLNEVTIPCLLIMDTGEEANTRVLSHDDADLGKTENVSQPKWLGSPVSASTAHKVMSTVSENEGAHGLRTIRMPESDSLEMRKDIDILDWHRSVFGDPFFTSVVANNYSSDIRDGLLFQMEDDPCEAANQFVHLTEDLNHANARQLLYQCYHAVATIVTEYYRMDANGDDRELPARKHLVQTLQKLDDLDDTGGNIHHHLPSILHFAKRQKKD